MCKLVKGVIRSESHQFTAEDAAKHDFFSLVFLPKSFKDQLANGGYDIIGGVPPWAEKVPHNHGQLAPSAPKPHKTPTGGGWH